MVVLRVKLLHHTLISVTHLAFPELLPYLPKKTDQPTRQIATVFYNDYKEVYSVCTQP